jgi:hypothetical protein
VTLAIIPEALPNAYADAAVRSPEWWLRRLHTELAARLPELFLFDDYYSGNHPLPWLPHQARAEFRRILAMTRSNYMGLVPDATAERLNVDGFRLPGQEEADQDTWRLWKSNDLDDGFDQAILEALVGGTAYTQVEPANGVPNIYLEHASQAIIGYEPGSNRRRKAASLKLWVDDWTGKLCATVDLGQWLCKFEADMPKSGALDPARITWRRREVAGESWPVRNPLGEVAMSELANNPRLLTGGVSELADVTDIQDRINKTIADRLITQDFGAFPQKWATGYPEEDSDGNPAEPLDIGRDRLISTDIAETKFGQFDSAPMDPYSAAKREDVKDIASRTRTPAQYLLGEMSNVSGDTLKASESGLVAKVRQRQRSFGRGAVETMRLARLAAGLPVPDERMEVIWKNPEFRTEGETTDAAVKQVASGIRDIRAAREFVGISQTEIAQMEAREATIDPIATQLAKQFQAGAGMTNATTAGDPGAVPDRPAV